MWVIFLKNVLYPILFYLYMVTLACFSPLFLIVFVLSRSLSLTLVNYFGKITFLPFALTKLMILNFKSGIIHRLQDELCQILILKLKELFSSRRNGFHMVISPVLNNQKAMVMLIIAWFMNIHN